MCDIIRELIPLELTGLIIGIIDTDDLELFDTDDSVQSRTLEQFSPNVSEVENARNHDSPQWYDIVHFEQKLSWLFF